MTHLHIFALNEPSEVSHTNLTRQKGEAPDLPPLAAWLGADTLNTDEIELFPVDDLADLSLSDYIDMAFTPADDIAADIKTRLNALGGSVLLVPDRAVAGAMLPGAQLTAIAQIPLAVADNTASLPKAEVTAAPAAPSAPPEPEAPPPIALFALIGMAILALLIVFIGWS